MNVRILLPALFLIFLLHGNCWVQAANPFDESGVVTTPESAVDPSKVRAIPDLVIEPPTAQEIQKPSSSLFSKAKGFFGNLKKKFDNTKSKLSSLFGEARTFWNEVSNISGWFGQGNLSKKEKSDLQKLAESRPELAWPQDRPIALGRNAHFTNTPQELKTALQGDYDWLECDVRLEGPVQNFLPVSLGQHRPIVAHDAFQTNGMLFEDWLDIVKKSGRGLKMDFKQNQTLDEVLALLKKASIPEHRLILNIGVPTPEKSQDLSTLPADPRPDKIRADFPQALINLSPSGKDLTDGHYSEREILQLIRFARKAGPPAMFPLRAELVTPEIVRALKPFGMVAIWNSPRTYSPENVEEAIQKFRGWGVDGMIDLRSSH